ncbi:MAG: hypothetical protein IKW38_05905 [Kiritimatiellae bacterium]|nr:hypothetical protein [Kiritimatiellia bacterium]
MSPRLLNVRNTIANIAYRLIPLPYLVRGKQYYAARAEIHPASLKTIAQQMVREGSKYAEHEILGIAEQMMDVIIDNLRHGRSVNFGSVMRFRPTIKGAFTNKDEAFDSSKHQLLVSVSAGSRLRHALEGVAVECVDQVNLPEIRSVVVEHPGATHLVEVIGAHLYQKNLGSGASWWIRTAEKQNPITEVVQKRTGRNVTFLLPQSTFPIGTEATFVLKVGKNEFCSDPIRL